MLQPRADQVAAIDALRASLRSGKKRPMLQAPTGWGKTVAASAVVNSALAKKKRIIFTVPALSLIDQAVRDFYEQGINDVGVIQAQHEMTDWSQPVQICSVQTLQKRGFPQGDLILIDEAHKWFDLYGKWMLDPKWINVPFIGLSATPWTRGLGRYYDDLIIASTTQRMIDAGILADFKVYAPDHPDLSGVRTVAGDYHEGELSAAMGKSPLVANIVDTWLARGDNRPTLVFAVDRAHAKRIQLQFQNKGVLTDYIDAFTHRNERDAVRRRFHDGSTKVVCNVGCLTTGIDWDVRCIILARPTKSEILFVQMVGRGLRTANGKDHCLILDHSDTHLRIGFVTDIHHEHLDDGRARGGSKTDRVPLPKECPKCAFLKPPRSAKCPACGFVCEAHSKIEPRKGELKELKRGKQVATMYEKSSFYAQLRQYGADKGYAEGWASNKYREKFGVWPNGFKHVMPQLPTPETLSWIRSRQIAWAKSKYNPLATGVAHA